MSWSKTKAPNFRNPKHGEPIKAPGGWSDPQTGEVMVAGRSFAPGESAGGITSVKFALKVLEQGADLAVIVHCTEKVDCPAGASITVASSGEAESIVLYAAEQLDTADIVFDKQVDNETPAVVPSETATLSIEAQSLTGLIVDAGTADETDVAISADIASAAGIREIE